MSLYLRDARWIDWRTHEIRRGHLRIGDGTLAFVDEIPAAAAALDCAGKWVTKGLAIGHHHIYSTLARGMPAPKSLPTDFVGILRAIWWQLDVALDHQMIRASARACAIDALRCGATFIIDHHSSPRCAAGSLHVLAEALDEIGIGHLLCYELSDRDGPDAFAAGVQETHDYLENHQALVGMHASFTVSDASLARAVALASECDTGLHVHVAEAQSDQDDCQRVHGQRVLERFSDHGVLRDKSLLAHCLHLDDDERRLLQQSPAWVVQNTESNQNNGVGRFVAHGIGGRTLIGTDGMHSDALRSARAAYLDDTELSPIGADQRLRRVHSYLAASGFRGDGDDNVVVLDYDPPTPIQRDNWAGHLMYGVRAAHVDSVICGGRVVMTAGQFATIDEERIHAQAREQASRLWAKM